MKRADSACTAYRLKNQSLCDWSQFSLDPACISQQLVSYFLLIEVGNDPATVDVRVVVQEAVVCRPKIYLATEQMLPLVHVLTDTRVDDKKQGMRARHTRIRYLSFAGLVKRLNRYSTRPGVS